MRNMKETGQKKRRIEQKNIIGKAEQKKLEIPHKNFQDDRIGKIEEDNIVRVIGRNFEHPDDFHFEGKNVASVDGCIKEEKLMSSEEFGGETFAVSPTFEADMVEEGRISQRKLEKAKEEFGKSHLLIRW